MKPSIITFPSRDGKTTIYAEKYVPDKEIRGILIVAHGMNEHFGKYREMCEVLSSEGYLTAGLDHLGHGHTARDYQKEFGFIADNDGATVLVRDLHRLKKLIQAEYPDIPIFILGHSMGSFILRNYIQMYGTGIKGAIIMGTGRFSSTRYALSLPYVRFSALLHGWHYKDHLCTKISFGSFAKMFPEDGPLGWICARKLPEDPEDKSLCGDEFTLNGYFCLITLIKRMQDRERMKAVPRNLPLFLMSGEKDPVGGNGEKIRELFSEYKSLGFTDVSMKLYPEDRHEIFHEKDRFNVFFDIMGFMKDHGC